MLALVKKPQNISNVMTQSFARMVNGVARNIQMKVSNDFFNAIKIFQFVLSA